MMVVTMDGMMVVMMVIQLVQMWVLVLVSRVYKLELM
jgi:hypothetical protein